MLPKTSCRPTYTEDFTLNGFMHIGTTIGGISQEVFAAEHAY